MLSAAQQERFSRHLLLDDLGGEGQERLAAGAAVVDLPQALAQEARWAVRYLAASGIGTLLLRGPWAAEAARECAGRWPETRILLGGAAPDGAVQICAAEAGASADAGEQAGSQIAIAAAARQETDGAALGALAALEALKRIAQTGRPFPQPLRPAAPEGPR